MLFVEAPGSTTELKDIPRQLADSIPLMANMVEGGMTPMVNAKTLQEMGYSLVIFPGGVVRAMAHAAAAFYATLMADGSSDAFRNQMFDFQGLNAAIGTPEMLALANVTKRADNALSRSHNFLDPSWTPRTDCRRDGCDALRSAFNPIIAEARDACHGLYHAETGATLVQGQKGLPIFVGAMAFAVKAVIEHVTAGAARGATPSSSTTRTRAVRISMIFVWYAR